jgi:AcrR family transcriptional regulator
MGLLESTPPDNTGTETLSRFRYQAALAIPYCLACVCGEGVKSIILEHYEDIVIEYPDQWVFAQVKSRNPDQPHWRLTSAMGGLGSLLRAFRDTEQLNASYRLLLEGSVASDDVLSELMPGAPTQSENLKARLQAGLSINDDECERFLGRLTVQPEQVPRTYIDSYMERLLGQSAPHMSQPELEHVVRQITDELFAAMAEGRLGSLLTMFIADSANLDEANRARVEGKRFTRERLLPFLGGVTSGPLPLLRRLASADTDQPTNLERKLLAAGANNAVVVSAKNLRANATIRALEVQTAGIFDEPQMEDVRERLISLAIGVIAPYTDSHTPANRAWADLQRALHDQVSVVDSRKIYGGDPFLLLGAACDLCDECLFDWGIPVA